MKGTKYIATAVLVSFFLSGTPYYPSMADDLEDQLQEIQGQIDSSRNEQSSWQQVIDDVTAKLKSIQADLDAANARLRNIQSQQAQISAQIVQTQNDIKAAEIHLKTRQNILNRRVRVIYMHGQLNYISVILGAHSFSDFANRVALLKRVIHSDYSLITEIERQKAAIEAKEQQLEQDKKQLDVLAQQAQQAQQEIQNKKSEQQKVLDQARSNKAAAEQMEQDLINQSNQVQALIQQRLAAAQAAANASGGGGEAGYTQGSGVLSWPCNGPITSPYGYRVHPIFGTTIFHSGMDIGVDYGTPIHAADSGTVIYAGWISGYGNAVIIDHGNGMQTLYGHNQSLNVSEGQSVSKGDVIAYAGSTGNSTGPHCHFEVRNNGSPVDPMAYL